MKMKYAGLILYFLVALNISVMAQTYSEDPSSTEAPAASPTTSVTTSATPVSTIIPIVTVTR